MNLDCGLLDLKSFRHDKLIQQQIAKRIRQLSGSDKKGTDIKIMSQRGGC